MLKLLHTGCKRDAVEKKYKLTALDLAFIYSDIESIALLTSHGAENTLRLLSVSEFYEVCGTPYVALLWLMLETEYQKLNLIFTTTECEDIFI